MYFFKVKATNTGYKFDFMNNEHDSILHSEVYTLKTSCLNGIDSIKRSVELCHLEDQSIDQFEKVSNPKFEVYKDSNNHFRFRIKAVNGQIIGASDAYSSKSDCLLDIKNICENVKEAVVQE